MENNGTSPGKFIVPFICSGESILSLTLDPEWNLLQLLSAFIASEEAFTLASVFTFVLVNQSYRTHWTPNEIYCGFCQRLKHRKKLSILLKFLFWLYPWKRKYRNSSSVGNDCSFNVYICSGESILSHTLDPEWNLLRVLSAFKTSEESFNLAKVAILASPKWT